MTAKKHTNRPLFLFCVSLALWEAPCGQASAQGENGWLGQLLGVNQPTISHEADKNTGVQDKVGYYPGRALELADWVTVSANLDLGYRTTNFFEPDHDTTLFLGDSRIEFWIPPWDKGLAWGPYIRLAGIASNRDPAWENAWLAGPGLGFQAYPFSHPWVYEKSDLATNIFGPLRLFAERNRLYFLHEENEWRPDAQTRVGMDYWRAINVNDTHEPLWTEIWSGLFWQSATEFDDDYDSVIFGNAVRGGVRLPKSGTLSTLTPYVLLESSLTDNGEYFWENKLVGGVGLRLTPHIREPTRDWLTRLVVFAEYLEVVDYYRQEGPSGTPDHDFRAGISLSIGEWYRAN